MGAEACAGRPEDLFKVFARVHQAAATVGVASDHKLAREVLRFGPGLKRHGRVVPPGEPQRRILKDQCLWAEPRG